MAINWPNAPTDGQRHTEQGQTWEWNATAGVWTIVAGTDAEFLPITGGTVTGPLVANDSLTVNNGFVSNDATTLNGSATMTQGATSNEELLIDKSGDKGVTFQDGAGVTQGRFGWISAALAMVHGGVTKFMTTATGVRATQDMQIDGNLAVTGTTTLGQEPAADMQAATKAYVDNGTPRYNAAIFMMDADKSFTTPTGSGQRQTLNNPTNNEQYGAPFHTFVDNNIIEFTRAGLYRFVSEMRISSDDVDSIRLRITQGPYAELAAQFEYRGRGELYLRNSSGAGSSMIWAYGHVEMIRQIQVGDQYSNRLIAYREDGTTATLTLRSAGTKFLIERIGDLPAP